MELSTVQWADDILFGGRHGILVVKALGMNEVGQGSIEKERSLSIDS